MAALVAAPVFHEVATEALRVMEVPRDLPDEKPATEVTAADNADDDLSDANQSDADNILLAADDDADAPETLLAGPPGPTVPNFRGMNMRAVLAEAAQKGLTILPTGSGIARLQYPPPGSLLHGGERIRVQFVR